MGAWLGGRPGGPRGPAWSDPAATVFWGTRVLGCVGGVSSPAANSGVWLVVSCFSVRRRSDWKVADSTARETGGKQQEAKLPSASSYKTGAQGSPGVRAGPRQRRRAGSRLWRHPTPVPPGERQLFCNLCSPAPRFHALWGKGRPGARSRQTWGRASAPPEL